MNIEELKAENEEQRKIIQCKTGTILSLAKIRDELKSENEKLKKRKDKYYLQSLEYEGQIQELLRENEKLKQQLKQQQYKRELDFGQGYKAYATERGVIIE